MIKIENVEIVGFEAAIRGMRNPMNSWEKSDSDCTHCMKNHTKRDCESCDIYIGPNDLDLMMQLRNAGTDHRKFMRMITVYVDILAPLYWWKEFRTYRAGVKFSDESDGFSFMFMDMDIEMNSCSTMHKIAAKEFTLEDFSCEHLYPSMLEGADDGYYDKIAEEFLASEDVLKITINALNVYRNEYIWACDDLKLAKDPKDIASLKEIQKRAWWQMIQLLPSSYNQRRTVMLNYEVLANIYKSRRNHKLDEWRELCEWIETLPYSELITGKE